MAIVDAQGFVRGKLNDEVIYRKLNGKNVLQYKPTEVKRSFKAKLAAHEFGMASNVAKTIRMLAAKPKELRDAYMHVRLNSLLTKSLRRVNRNIGERDISNIDPGDLIGFQFNMDAPFERTISFPLDCSVSEEGKISFQLPPMDQYHQYAYLKTAAGKGATPSIELTVASVSLTNGKAYIWMQEEITPDGSETKTKEFQFPWEKGSLVLLFVSLTYFRQDWTKARALTGSREFFSSGILASFFVDENMAQYVAAHPELSTQTALHKLNYRQLGASKKADIRNEIKSQKPGG